jgi:hypothetical protein
MGLVWVVLLFTAFPLTAFGAPGGINGVLVNPSGTIPIEFGWIDIHDDQGNPWMGTATDSDAHFSIFNLPPGEYILRAYPPIGYNPYETSPPVEVEVFSGQVTTTTLFLNDSRASKTVDGQVVFEGTTMAVSDAKVWAHRIDGLGEANVPADGNGAFAMHLTAGRWHLSAEPISPSNAWIFPGPPTLVVVGQPLPLRSFVAEFGSIGCPSCEGDLDQDDDVDGIDLAIYCGPQTETITLEVVSPNAWVKGRVTNQTGAGVPDVPVFGRQPEGVSLGWTATDTNGDYTIPVIGSTWFVGPVPGSIQPFVFRQDQQIVRLAPGGTMMHVNFSLMDAAARIRGTAVDINSGQRVITLGGEARAGLYVGPPLDFEFFSAGPLSDGFFELKVSDGETYNLALNISSDESYVSGSDTVSLLPAELLKEVEISLEPKNAVIQGVLIDALTGSPPDSHVVTQIFGEDGQGHWTTAHAVADNSYSLGVASGTWHLQTRMDPETGYAPTPNPVAVTVTPGQTTIQNLEVYPINTTISGQIVAPDGTTPVASADVFAEGESPYGSYFESHTTSDSAGNFELMVREGTYLVNGTLPAPDLESRGWLNPLPVINVVVSASSPAPGLALTFRALNGQIQGMIYFAPGFDDKVPSPSHPARIWAWANSSEWTETEAPVISGTNTFSYTLPVLMGTTWHVGAIYEDSNNGVYFESPEVEVPVLPPSGQVTQDLALAGDLDTGQGWPLPQPIIVSFDGSQMQTIVMPNGVELNIPAGALVKTGAPNTTVTLYIFSLQGPQVQFNNENIGVGYEFWAVDSDGHEITQFNPNVNMTFNYPSDTDLEQQQISEFRLIPLYYSTLMGRWILAVSYEVDTSNNEIKQTLEHF